MIKNIFCYIEYKGTNYFGFQIQEKADKAEITVQEIIENALESLFKEKIRIQYSSRTDRGVHALAQAINFKVDTKIPLRNLRIILNKKLPWDIKIKTIKYVPLDFHPRFKAVSKIYRYIILNKKEPSVFWTDLAWHISDKLDLALMQEAAKYFLGRQDFSSLAKDSKHYKDCIRNIKDISIKKSRGFIYIDVEGEGFLRNMVRNIVALLVKVGQNKIKVEAVPKIIAREKSHINKPALAGGLYLVKVKY